MSKRDRDDAFGARGDMGLPCNRIFVYGLPYSMDWQQLSDHFNGVGKIIYAGIKTDDKGQSRGFGVVEFERIDEAMRAIERYNGSNIGSRVIKVRYDTKDTPGGPEDNQPAKYARQEAPPSYGMGAPMMGAPMMGVNAPMGGGGGSVGGNMMGVNAGPGYGLLPGYTHPSGMPGGVLNYGSVGYGNGFIPPAQGGQGMMHQGQGMMHQGQMMGGSDGMMLAPGMMGMGMGQPVMAPGMGGGVGQYGMGMGMGMGTGGMGGGAGGGYGGGYGGGVIRGEKGSTLFVSNMAYSTTSQRLREVFGRYGVLVSCNVMTERSTGKSKGCATVEFQYARDAYAAMKGMQNTPLDGRTIYVREDSLDPNDRGGHQDAPPARREPEPTKKPPMEWGDRSAPLGGFEKRDCQIVVHGLNYCADVNDLLHFLRDAGPILHARIMIDSESKSRGWGTVLFNTPQCAERCLERFDKVELKGRKISIKRDEKA